MSQQATPTPNPTTPPTIAPPVDADAAAQKPEELPLHQLRHSGDWRKGKSYPLPGSRNYQVWAWEFLRRNAEYGAFALWCCQSLPKELLTRQSPKSKDLIQHLICGFDAPATVTMYGEYKQWCKTENQPCLAVTPNQYLRTRWGITHPLLPLQSFPTKKKQKAEYKNPPKFLSNSISYFLPTWGKEFEPMALHEINFLGTNGIRSKIAANEALIRFRLGEPIKKQIERANVFLDKWQRRYLTAKHSGNPPTSIKPDIPTPDRDLPSRTDVVALHYMLRILDAAHDPLIPEGGLTEKIASELLTLFRREIKEDYFFKKPRIVDENWEPPAFNKSQIKSWYEWACHHVTQGGYLAVAAYKPKDYK